MKRFVKGVRVCSCVKKHSMSTDSIRIPGKLINKGKNKICHSLASVIAEYLPQQSR